MDRIFSLRPVNRQAAMVTGGGVHYTTPQHRYGNTVWQDTPIPTQPLHKSASEPHANLTGLRVGRLVVVGYHGTSKNGARWVVRCVCGSYGLQKGNFLRRAGAEKRAMCPSCDNLEYLRGTQARADRSVP